MEVGVGVLLIMARIQRGANNLSEALTLVRLVMVLDMSNRYCGLDKALHS